MRCFICKEKQTPSTSEIFRKHRICHGCLNTHDRDFEPYTDTRSIYEFNLFPSPGGMFREVEYSGQDIVRPSVAVTFEGTRAKRARGGK